MIEETPHITYPLQGAVKLGGSDSRGRRERGRERGGEAEEEREKEENRKKSLSNSETQTSDKVARVELRIGRSCQCSRTRPLSPCGQSSPVGMDGLAHEVP